MKIEIIKNGIVENRILLFKLITPIKNINVNRIPNPPMPIYVNVLFGFFLLLTSAFEITVYLTIYDSSKNFYTFSKFLFTPSAYLSTVIKLS